MDSVGIDSIDGYMNPYLSLTVGVRTWGEKKAMDGYLPKRRKQ